MATVTALRRAPANAPRFDYAVRPAGGKWEVRVGNSGTRFVYATQDDAAAVAHGAAKLHWTTRREPCEATLQEGEGHVRTLVRFGS